jgi:uncharacterized membrane protein
MFDKPRVGETHTRTLVKLVCYRILSICATVLLTLLLCGSMVQALTMGAGSLLIGSVHYYVYDRVWLLFGWKRDRLGKDHVVRSVVKSVIYRLTALILIALLARVVFAETNMMAFLLAVLKSIVNATSYYILERLFNRIQWGRKIQVSKKARY